MFAQSQIGIELNLPIVNKNGVVASALLQMDIKLHHINVTEDIAQQ